jgi:hypothetical protein
MYDILGFKYYTVCTCILISALLLVAYALVIWGEGIELSVTVRLPGYLALVLSTDMIDIALYRSAAYSGYR